MTLEQLQQLAASKLAAATAAGVASGATKPQPARATNSTNPNGPQVKASSGLNDKSHQPPTASHFTMALIQKWILAEVGLVAQQALAQPQVRAADSTPAQEDIPKVVTADSAMDGQEAYVSSQPRGSKNQDPGIAVDPDAVSRPGELRASCTAWVLGTPGALPGPGRHVWWPHVVCWSWTALRAVEHASRASILQQCCQPGIRDAALSTTAWQCTEHSLHSPNHPGFKIQLRP